LSGKKYNEAIDQFLNSISSKNSSKLVYFDLLRAVSLKNPDNLLSNNQLFVVNLLSSMIPTRRVSTLRLAPILRLQTLIREYF
jgi:hypothetical protein